MKVYVSDARAADLCVTGMREYAKRFNLDLKKFIREGIDAEELLAKTNNDGHAVAVVEAARVRKVK